ncbi:MAG TPA: adenylyl-sulfate kinase [Telluria sp.]
MNAIAPCVGSGHVGRRARDGRRGAVVWFTGLSGSGKSTVANLVRERLADMGHGAYVIDGDRVRQGLCSDLGFSPAERAENIRRVGEVASLFVDAGFIVLSACISPFMADRQRVRSSFAAGEFLEVYCSAPLAVCEARDVKGLYARARAGLIKEFTGISSPYEAPVEAELCLDSGVQDIGQAVAEVVALLRARGIAR